MTFCEEVAIVFVRTDLIRLPLVRPSIVGTIETRTLSALLDRYSDGVPSSAICVRGFALRD